MSCILYTILILVINGAITVAFIAGVIKGIQLFANPDVALPVMTANILVLLAIVFLVAVCVLWWSGSIEVTRVCSGG